MLEDHLRYRTCIVRAWREGPGAADGAGLRLTLEVPSLGLRKGFSSYQELTDSLWHHLSEDADTTHQDGRQQDLPPHDEVEKE